MSLSFFLNAAKQTWDNDLSKKQKEIEKKLMHERERERELVNSKNSRACVGVNLTNKKYREN